METLKCLLPPMFHNLQLKLGVLSRWHSSFVGIVWLRLERPASILNQYLEMIDWGLISQSNTIHQKATAKITIVIYVVWSHFTSGPFKIRTFSQECHNDLKKNNSFAFRVFPIASLVLFCAFHMLVWNRLSGPVKKPCSWGWFQMVDHSSQPMVDQPGFESKQSAFS